MSKVASVQYSPAPAAQYGSSIPAPSAPAAAATEPAPSGPAPVPNSAAVNPAASPAPGADSAPPTQPAPQEVVSVVPARSTLVVRNNVVIDSKVATPGQTYSGVVVRNVLDGRGRVVIPHGAPATLVVRSATDQGKVQGQSELALDIESVVIAGRRYRVETADLVEKGRAGVGANKRTAGFIGGGTVLGTLLGAVAGGGRGAAIGAVSGAAAGTATQAVTRGKGVRVPAETLMTFRLEAPIRVREIR